MFVFAAVVMLAALAVMGRVRGGEATST